MYERLQHSVNGPDADHIPVIPTAHYMMGGVKVDSNGMSSINRLYCAGESSGGIHGANRLGGNGLTDALAWGKLSGAHAAKQTRLTHDQYPEVKYVEKCQTYFKSYQSTATDALNIHEGLMQLRQTMDKYMGPVRVGKGMMKALSIIRRLKQMYTENHISWNINNDLQMFLDFRSLIHVSELCCQAAVFRLETRGAHFREDFPDTRQNVYIPFSVKCDNNTALWTPQPVAVVVGYNNTRSYDVEKIRKKVKNLFDAKLLLVKKDPASNDFMVADYIFDINLDDHKQGCKRVLDQLTESKLHVIAVLPFSDRGVVIGAQLANELCLPGYNANRVIAGLDKYKYRSLEKDAREALVSTIKFINYHYPICIEITSEEQLLEVFRTHGPLMCKAKCEGNKRGCHRISTEEDVKSAWLNAQQYMSDGVYIESYIDSKFEYSYDSAGGSGASCWITEKRVDRNGKSRYETQDIVPAANIATQTQDQLIHAGHDVSVISGGTNNNQWFAAHNELFWLPETQQIAVIEPNLRPSGGRIWDLATLAFEEFDPWEQWILTSAGMSI
jgi:hypothetical protein